MEKTDYTVSKRDKSILRDTAKQVKDIAESPVMAERIKAWTDNNDLKPSRTMVLLELAGLGPEKELLYSIFPKAGAFMERKCEGEFAYELEKGLKDKCLERMTINDDTVVDKYFNISWEADPGDYGVEIKRERGIDRGGRDVGFHTVTPIKDPAKALDILKPRSFSHNKADTLAKKEAVEDVFGDILTVRIRNTHWWTMGLTWVLIDLIGMENMMMGMVDDPEAIHGIMDFLCEDHIRHARYLEGEGLFCPNGGNDYIGSGSRGFTSDLPEEGKRPEGGAYLRDCWVLLESQETTVVSPAMFAEFVLPYHKKIAELFGLVYYGCCEPLDSRIKYIKTIPNLRSLSVSPWCDENIMAEVCAGSFVYSRKPAPSELSGPSVDWDGMKKGLEKTLRTAGGCNLKIIMKDLHTTAGDITRVRDWVDMARALASSPGG